MATVAPPAPIHAPSASHSSTLRRMSSRKLFSRSRKPAPPLSVAPLEYNGSDSRVASGSSYATIKPSADPIFTNRDTNKSTSALSTSSTASRTSRFFRKFSRQKPPPVPSLPPALVLDLDAGTALPRGADASSHDTVYRIQRQAATPTTAAAAIIAAAAAAESIPKPHGVQRRRMLEAMSAARLDVAQTRDLVRMCGLQLRERGLDTPGLFRPFRVAESLDHVHRMVQLLLLSIDPSTYGSVFSILPENALDRIGTTSTSSPSASQRQIAHDELDKELRYASPHDIVSLLKWGLRHARLSPTDFNSPTPDGWYDAFVTRERECGYHPRSIADHLHPSLPQPTAELLSEILDLMASITAHSTSNHMPPSTLCRILGMWLFARPPHPPATFDDLLSASTRATSIAEHLLLAHIRAQAAVTFAMPGRLTELIRGYPVLCEGRPGLPAMARGREVEVLRVDVRSEGVVGAGVRGRGPMVTLTDALGATSDGHEVWEGIVKQLEGRGVDGLVIDEHLRILRQVERGTDDAAGTSTTSKDDSATTAHDTSGRRRSQTLSNLQPRGPPPLMPLPETPRGEVEELHPAPKHAEVFNGNLNPTASWRSFTDEGFLSTASSDLSLSSFDLKPLSSTLPASRRSHRSLSRKSIAPAPVFPPIASKGDITHTITSVRKMELDPALALLWQDTLQDQSPCSSLPRMTLVQLQPRYAAQVGEGSWLLVVQTCIPPRPPTPEEKEVDGRSVFAPSMRSVRMRLRRVSTVIGAGVRRKGGLREA